MNHWDTSWTDSPTPVIPPPGVGHESHSFVISWQESTMYAWRGAMTTTSANQNFGNRALSPPSTPARKAGPAGSVQVMKSEQVERVPISAWRVPKSTFISIEDVPAVVKQHVELIAGRANPLWRSEEH